MEIRLRFAPSPTGKIHLGNIRAAIFNWLYARHVGGQFLLRIEDTDRERSTPEAIAQVFACMEWLGLNYDEEPVYQTRQVAAHLAAAERLLASGQAYRHAKGEGGEAVIFRLPWNAPTLPFVRDDGEQLLEVHSEVPLTVSFTGLTFAQVGKNGQPVAREAALAGYQGLEALDAAGQVVFALAPEYERIIRERATVTVAQVRRLRFRRYSVCFHDLVKGDLAKPLDSMSDLVLVRSDGTPVFHLANVCDDLTQRVTHIVRGDDHVENTYRHLFLFQALGATPPQYGHLPMIVNSQGKKYSKRDGAAYVGEFRDQGYLPEALFNYLTLLGWSPGNDIEKINRADTIRLFTLDRVKSAPAQMDLNKLFDLNGQYMAELDVETFTQRAAALLNAEPWAAGVDPAYFARVAALMRSRTKLFSHVREWGYFFTDAITYDEKAVRKNLQKPGLAAALRAAAERVAASDFTPAGIEAAIHATTEAVGIEHGKLNVPLRVAVTGCTVGAGLYETMTVLGRDRVLARLRHAAENLCAAAPAGAAAPPSEGGPGHDQAGSDRGA